jgi:PST family polysaccharide transporter
LSDSDKTSYGQILKSSALIGGSSAINVAIGIIRTKAMAVLLGPDGFGLMGVYGSIANLAQSIAGMGVNGSGVRQIAEAVGSGQTERVERTALVLRRVSVVLGVLGAVLLVVCSRHISAVTFGDEQHAVAVALLSLAVFFSLVSGGQAALIQGTRRIADLAKVGIIGSVCGLLISIPLVYFLREKGVVPSIIGVAAVTFVTSWWYSRKVPLGVPAMTTSQVRHDLSDLLKLGFAFMASGLLTLGAAYAVRTMVLRMEGLEAAGYYHAAWTVGSLYVGFILQSMGADFYPRLTAVAHDHAICNRLVNEQAQISLLLAGPGVIGTLTFASVIVSVFYSAEFGAAVEVLRWICLGTALQVITWPLGFVIVAKGAQRTFFVVELAWAVVNVGLSWLCVDSFGFSGAGIAFFLSYVFHWMLLYPVVRRLSGFSWSSTNRKSGMLFLALITAVFCGFYFLPILVAFGVGGLTLLFSIIYSVRVFANLVSLDQIPSSIRRFVTWFRLVPSGS